MKIVNLVAYSVTVPVPEAFPVSLGIGHIVTRHRGCGGHHGRGSRWPGESRCMRRTAFVLTVHLPRGLYCASSCDAVNPWSCDQSAKRPGHQMYFRSFPDSDEVVHSDREMPYSRRPFPGLARRALPAVRPSPFT